MSANTLQFQYLSLDGVDRIIGSTLVPAAGLTVSARIAALDALVDQSLMIRNMIVNGSNPASPTISTETDAALTATGFSGTAPSGTAKVTKAGNSGTMQLPAISGTSNATTYTLGTLAAALRPARTQVGTCIITDNGVNSVGQYSISTGGVITFSKDVTGAAFTNTGTKGSPAQTIHYSFD